MSIRTSFNPLGTLGAGGIKRLDFVTVDGIGLTANQDLVVAALGGNYDIQPRASDGYFFEAKCTDFDGTRTKAILGPCGVYTSQWNHTPYGKLVCYVYESSSSHTWMVRMTTPGGLKTVRSYDYPIDKSWFWARYENGKLKCASDTLAETTFEVSSWEASESGTERVRLVRVAGFSYKFHGLRVQTTAQSFAALPARLDGVDGIAFYVDGADPVFLAL